MEKNFEVAVVVQKRVRFELRLGRGSNQETIRCASQLKSLTALQQCTKFIKVFVYNISSGDNLEYRTRAIITRGLYIFYPIFQCGL